MRFAKYSLTQPLNRNLLFWTVAEKATLQLLIARSLFAYRVSHSHIAYRVRVYQVLNTINVNPGKECTWPAIYNLLSVAASPSPPGPRSRELANLGVRPRGRGRGSRYRQAEARQRLRTFDRNPTPRTARLLWQAICEYVRPLQLVYMFLVRDFPHQSRGRAGTQQPSNTQKQQVGLQNTTDSFPFSRMQTDTYAHLANPPSQIAVHDYATAHAQQSVVQLGIAPHVMRAILSTLTLGGLLRGRRRTRNIYTSWSGLMGRANAICEYVMGRANAICDVVNMSTGTPARRRCRRFDSQKCVCFLWWRKCVCTACVWALVCTQHCKPSPSQAASLKGSNCVRELVQSST